MTSNTEEPLFFRIGPHPNSGEKVREEWSRVTIRVYSPRWAVLPKDVVRLNRDAYATTPAYYVYIIKDAKGRPIYVGKGSSNRVITAMREKNGASGEIVAWKMTSAEARIVERCLLGIMGRKGIDPDGFLLNRRDETGSFSMKD